MYVVMPAHFDLPNLTTKIGAYGGRQDPLLSPRHMNMCSSSDHEQAMPAGQGPTNTGDLCNGHCTSKHISSNLQSVHMAVKAVSFICYIKAKY
jgi:hypothetical protein